MNAYKNKIRIQNAITYAIVIGCYILIQIMMAGGHVNSLLKGILVPLCTYTILAVSLNLTVGILGELSLGHAGFMCAGAFSGAFFNHAMKNVIASNQVRFILALFVGAAVAAVFGILIGIPVLRLKGDYLAIVTLAFGEIVKSQQYNVQSHVADKNEWDNFLKILSMFCTSASTETASTFL